MYTVAQLNSGFQVGAWKIDPQAGDIIRDGVAKHIEPKVMDVLIILASNAGELVTREALMDQVWPDVVVTDDVLTRCISELRNLLGDTGKNKIYIKTVPKRGYSLISPVRLKEVRLKHDIDLSRENADNDNSKRQQPVFIKTLWVPLILIFGLGAIWLVRDNVRAHEETAGDLSTIAVDADSVSQPMIESMVVLPFANLSNNPENEFFSDGLSEDIRNALINSTDIRVAARTSSVAFKGRAMDVRKIAGQLNVDALLEGTVRLVDDRMRVTTQLTSGVDGYPIWSKSYERPINDKLDLQLTIASEIVRELVPSLKGNVELIKIATTNVKAHEYYLLGRHNWHLRTGESVDVAIDHFKEALELDPMYAPAYSGLADSYIFASMYGNHDFETSLDQAILNASRAIELNPELAEAHASIGLVYEIQKEFQKAQSAYEKSVELKPQYSMGHMWLGNTYTILQNANKALEHHQVASVLDPLHPKVQSNYIEALMSVGNYDSAELIIDNLLLPNNDEGFQQLKLKQLLETGQYNRLLEYALRSTPGRDFAPYNSHNIIHALVLLGRFEEAQELIDSVDDADKKHSKSHLNSVLAIAKRDSETLRATQASRLDAVKLSYADNQECVDISTGSHLQIADYIDADHRKVIERGEVLERLYQVTDFCTSLPPWSRLSSINYSIASTLSLNEPAADLIKQANIVLDDLKSKGWATNSLIIEEMLLRLFEKKYKDAKILQVLMLEKGWQPFGMIQFNPLFDYFSSDDQVMKMVMNSKSRYLDLVEDAKGIKLAKLGL